MTTHALRLWHTRVHVTSLTTFMSTKHFLIEIILTLKVIKFHFKGSYDKRTLTVVVIYMKFMKLAIGSFHKYHMK